MTIAIASLALLVSTAITPRDVVLIPCSIAGGLSLANVAHAIASLVDAYRAGS